jgi:hypothetical protein
VFAALVPAVTEAAGGDRAPEEVRSP